MSRVIEIKGTSEEGLGHTTRLWIKDFFTQFGEVAQVHKPPSSGDPSTDVAFIRFAKEADAEKVVEILRKGTEMSNGTPIVGDWQAGKGKGGKGRPSYGVVDFNAPVEDSRSLATGRSRRSRSRGGRDEGRGGGGGRNDRNRGDRGSRRSESPRRRDNGRGRPRDDSRAARRGDRSSRRSPSFGRDGGRSRDDRNAGGGARRDDSRNR